MKRSLTRQITATICLVVACAIALCCILNLAFLKPYYIREKEKSLRSSFSTISDAGEKGILFSDAFDVTFDNICSNENISIMILQTNGLVVRTSVNDMETLQEQFFDLVQGVSESELIFEGDSYRLLKQEDTRLNSEYLILIGELESGELIIMKTALESIRESAAVSGRLLIVIGIVAVLIAVVIGSFLSRMITRPILRLTEISKRMVELDFDAKYVRGERGDTKRVSLRDRLIRRRQLKPIGREQTVPGNEIDQLGEYINRMSANLEKVISDLKSANVALQDDIEKKRQVDEMRKEFLSNVSHELKTPLALISGYAEGLRECVNEDASGRDFYCEVIMDESRKMNRMVSKLLTLNQLEFGDDAVSMERFDISELITGVVNSSRILFEQNGIRLLMDEMPQIYVWSDEYKTEEVISNFLSNAVHHCAGEKIIRIFYKRMGDKLRVSVYNTGESIPEKDIDRIWDKFYKVDKARTREYGGSGIGLSIVRAIMESLHCEYGVLNHPGGVEFWFEVAMR